MNCPGAMPQAHSVAGVSLPTAGASKERIVKMAKEQILRNSVPADRQAACDYLRAKHPRFVYESFSFDYAKDSAGDALRASFHFRIDPDIEFTPETVVEQIDSKKVQALPQGVLENLVFHMGL